jgi:SSS family solute:Na+ symporter
VQGMPPISKNDEVFPLFIMTKVPTVLKGFLIVAILSAAMSSVAAALSALASVSTMDFFKALSRKPRSEEFYLKFSKYSTVFWAGMLVFVAYLTKEVESVLETAFSLHGLTTGAMLGGLLLAMFWKKKRQGPVVAGMITSVIGMILIYLGFKTKIEWPWFCLMGTSICIAVAFLLRAVGGSSQAIVPGPAGQEMDSGKG